MKSICDEIDNHIGYDFDYALEYQINDIGYANKKAVYDFRWLEEVLYQDDNREIEDLLKTNLENGLRKNLHKRPIDYEWGGTW